MAPNCGVRDEGNSFRNCLLSSSCIVKDALYLFDIMFCSVMLAWYFHSVSICFRRLNVTISMHLGSFIVKMNEREENFLFLKENLQRTLNDP